MIELISGVSVVKQREYLDAENRSCDILRANGYETYGNASDNFKTVVAYKRISAHEAKFIGKYKNFQEAKEQLIH